jgi:hypothetical protein
MSQACRWTLSTAVASMPVEPPRLARCGPVFQILEIARVKALERHRGEELREAQNEAESLE